MADWPPRGYDTWRTAYPDFGEETEEEVNPKPYSVAWFTRKLRAGHSRELADLLELTYLRRKARELEAKLESGDY